MVRNPPPNERAADFLGGALFATFLQALVGTLSDALQALPASGNQPHQFLAIAGSIPGLVTLGGFAGATLLGGPLGFFGYIIGVAGGSMFIPPNINPIAGLTLAMVGGVMTWAGIRSGGWLVFIA